jgi:hypothetical protein
MKTRLAAIVAALGVALAVTSAVLIGVNYVGLNADLARADEIQPSPSYAPMPEADPAAQTPETPLDDPISPQQAEDERLHVIEWVEWQRLIDECMADAGFEEYSYSNDMTAEPFSPDYTAEQRAAAALALGGNPGAAADYRWEDAGCAGAATQQLGIGS